MRVQEIMTKAVVCTHPHSTLEEAARRMKELDVGLLPVCGDGDRLSGMLSDRDICIRAVATGADPRTTLVREVMTPEVLYCFEDDDLERASRVMRDHQVRRLVVLDRAKKLAGIVSLGDLAISTEEALAGHVLEGVSEPAKARH